MRTATSKIDFLFMHSNSFVVQYSIFMSDCVVFAAGLRCIPIWYPCYSTFYICAQVIHSPWCRRCTDIFFSAIVAKSILFAFFISHSSNSLGEGWRKQKKMRFRFGLSIMKGSTWLQKFIVNWYFIIKLHCGSFTLKPQWCSSYVLKWCWLGPFFLLLLATLCISFMLCTHFLCRSSANKILHQLYKAFKMFWYSFM